MQEMQKEQKKVTSELPDERAEARKVLKEKIKEANKARLELEISQVTDEALRAKVIANYKFGAGGFKLGQRVEVLSTEERGVLVGEVIHMTGCNTYQVLMPNVFVEGKQRIVNLDYNVLRPLESFESMLDASKELLDEADFYTPKGQNANPRWVVDSLQSDAEFIPEVDEAIGVEEILIAPGTEVYSKVHGIPMLVNYVYRSIYSKELDYGVEYRLKGKRHDSQARAYQLIPLRLQIDVYRVQGKPGPAFDDSRLFPGGFEVEGAELDYDMFGCYS